MGDLLGADQPAVRLTGLKRGRSATGSGALSRSLPTHGVSAVPGLTALTRMPSLIPSAAIARVSAATAPLLAE